MEKKKEPLVVAEIVKAVMAAGFAYIGYAAGGLLLMAMINTKAGANGTGISDTAAIGSNFKTQFMLVLFFINKPLAVFWIARKWQANQMALWVIFLLFWFIDASGLWLYQMIVFGAASIPTILFLGFFSAVIIATSIQRNYRKSSRVV
jgi:hypothetical protein